MTSVINMFVKTLLGPNVYRMHGLNGQQGQLYKQNIPEAAAEKVLRIISACRSIVFWLSPIVVTMLYKRGYFSVDGVVSILKLSGTFMIIYSTAVLARGIGRFTNTEYIKFINILEVTRLNSTPDNRNKLRNYDFDFIDWPEDYRSTSIGDRHPFDKIILHRSLTDRLKHIPYTIIGYVLIHSFGRGLVYPGSTSLMNNLLFTTLLDSRAKLIEEKNGIRGRVGTPDGNYLDTMFFDRRNSGYFSKGDTLVIACEGNAGFYEIGCMVTPLDAGYSVLGWNRPGFGQSSGKPSTNCEHNAADSIMQYAINSLGFLPENIIVFAWSIGGYDATYIAATYPDIKALILDATFDDLIPIAVTKMPQFASTIIEHALTDYLPLHLSPLIKQYDGPVLLIRRTRDEMITIGEGLVLETNRGNYLLMELLSHRFPSLMNKNGSQLLNRYIAENRLRQATLLQMHGVDDSICLSTLKSYASIYTDSYPMHIGDDLSTLEKEQLLLYLAFHHMIDFDSTHCTPLPIDHFHFPWTLK